MSTEDIHKRSENIDTMSTSEMINLMQDEDMIVVRAVQNVRQSIYDAVDDAVSSLKQRGRLFYIGAGTSGRLGVLDASEMRPTFGDASSIRAIMAGGAGAITDPVEGAEDDREAGSSAVADAGRKDMILGISASGKTPFVLSALQAGKDQGARCWLLSCNEVGYDFLDGIINVNVGPELVAGSTRLKSGTATKMVLNMISTATMIQMGHVYKGYMIDVVPSSAKLIKRAESIISAITGCGPEEAALLLKKADNRPKTAVLMYKKDLSLDQADQLLKKSDGSLRRALGDVD
ncbi:MAG: N-acetylmuramic acid 6-phosphate etherase [Nitrospiraceae bacterium]|nr:MAG: N-acetylmuramic acid 6-phosphate etherase [Nitrospiraceae bacterium]